MNYRQSWGSFSQDKMVYWDITVNVTGLEDACNEAEVFGATLVSLWVV